MEPPGASTIVRTDDNSDFASNNDMSMLLNGPIKDSDVATLGQKNVIGERSESMPPKSVKKVSFKGDHNSEEDKEESQPEKVTG